MARIDVRADGCRGCGICVDLCPTRVLALGPERRASAQSPADCIACLSCQYACPSGAIRASEYHAVKNFYRDVDFMKRTRSFL